MTIVALGSHNPSAGQSREPAYTVHFGITDCWGNRTPPVTLSITPLGAMSSRERLSYPSEDTARLAPGRYHILAEAQGMFPASSIFEVSATNLDFRTCLSVAPVTGSDPFFSKLQGAVSADAVKDEATLWARLVGLYNNASLTSSLDGKRQFSFSGLQPGRYLLIVLGAKGIIARKEIDIRWPATLVSFP